MDAGTPGVDGLLDEWGELIPFGKTPSTDGDTLVMVVPGSLPKRPDPNVSSAADYETPEAQRLFEKSKEFAAAHPGRFPLTGLYTVLITYRTPKPITQDEFELMTSIVSDALTEAGVIASWGVYGSSDFEIDRDLNDAYSLEIHRRSDS